MLTSPSRPRLVGKDVEGLKRGRGIDAEADPLGQFLLRFLDGGERGHDDDEISVTRRASVGVEDGAAIAAAGGQRLMEGGVGGGGGDGVGDGLRHQITDEVHHAFLVQIIGNVFPTKMQRRFHVMFRAQALREGK